jgi:hypothetical protein
MKKKFTKFIIILVAVVCQTGISPLFVHSQSYHKLIRTNTYWDNYITDVMCYSTIDRVFFTGYDTVIGGISYKMSREYPFAPVNQGPLCPPFIINNISYPTYTFIREDTTARRVYINLSGSDQLLYDFSLQVGDTLHSEYNGNPVVTAIDTVTLNDGEFRKRFSFGGFPNAYENYIESLGGSNGLFEPIYFNPDGIGGYLCISENDTSLWGTSCNYYFVGMKEQQESGLSVYPNPAKDKCKVQCAKCNIKSIEIFNLTGEKVYGAEFSAGTSNAVEVDLDFPAGIYFVKVTSERTVEIEKLIIN